MKAIASKTPATENKPRVVQQNSKPKITSDQQRLILIGTLATIFLGLVGGIYYLSSNLTKIATKIQTLRAQAISVQISDQDVLLLSKSLEDTQADRELLIKAFPNEETLLDFINLIDKLKSSKVEVMEFAVESDQPTKIGRDPSILPISLSLRGDQNELNEALKKITDSPYFIRTTNVVKEYNPNDIKQVVIKVQFHLFVSDEFTKVNS